VTAPAPLFASDRSAAKLLDMKRAEFRGLVDGGHLPKPKDIGGFKRWDMNELYRIVSGEAAEQAGGMNW
jgi:predicted DNA-binding transcriptional regulator AlpA